MSHGPVRPEDIRRIADFFEREVAFNRWLGLRVESIGEGRCVCRVPFRPELVGDPFRPALHGGVTSALADTAGGLAVYGAVGRIEARVSTVDLRVDYYAPARMEDLIAEAEVVRVGNRVGVSRVLVHHGDRDALIAEGKGVYNVHKPSARPA
jgi:uncharacterized protein (TIGR00369 family)